ncbi:CDP-glucose 4,6-dehydratase [Litorivicinus sp.]|nr:CDP-glucose 4,6-dehydratase [Litorivicinus sp.]
MIETTELYNAFKHKRVIVTGHTGFKGSWLVCFLRLLGADVLGISKGLVSTPSHWSLLEPLFGVDDQTIDVTDMDSLSSAFESFEPDYVFHLAAQSLVPRSVENPIETFQTNVIGTLNVLEVFRRLKNDCVAVFITSDKCYENKEWVWGYRETDQLGGEDPYSASKACADITISSFFRTFLQDEGNKKVGVARAGNVIGGGDWAASRVLPDCIRAWSRDEAVLLRKPTATRPWQHVIEPVHGYLTLALRLKSGYAINGEAFNFGPSDLTDKTVAEVVEAASSHWPGSRFEIVSENQSVELKEKNLLKLDIDKARVLLGWASRFSFEKAIHLTAAWYVKVLKEGLSAKEITESQIKYYLENNNEPWSF